MIFLVTIDAADDVFLSRSVLILWCDWNQCDSCFSLPCSYCNRLHVPVCVCVCEHALGGRSESPQGLHYRWLTRLRWPPPHHRSFIIQTLQLLTDQTPEVKPRTSVSVRWVVLYRLSLTDTISHFRLVCYDESYDGKLPSAFWSTGPHWRNDLFLLSPGVGPLGRRARHLFVTWIRLKITSLITQGHSLVCYIISSTCV